jgi:hypothetical protein
VYPFGFSNAFSLRLKNYCGLRLASAEYEARRALVAHHGYAVVNVVEQRPEKAQHVDVDLLYVAVGLRRTEDA